MFLARTQHFQAGSSVHCQQIKVLWEAWLFTSVREEKRPWLHRKIWGFFLLALPFGSQTRASAQRSHHFVHTFSLTTIKVMVISQIICRIITYHGVKQRESSSSRCPWFFWASSFSRQSSLPLFSSSDAFGDKREEVWISFLLLSPSLFDKPPFLKSGSFPLQSANKMSYMGTLSQQGNTDFTLIRSFQDCHWGKKVAFANFLDSSRQANEGRSFSIRAFIRLYACTGLYSSICTITTKLRPLPTFERSSLDCYPLGCLLGVYRGRTWLK